MFARERRRLVAAYAMLALPLLLSTPVVRMREQPTRAVIDAMPTLLARLPSGSAVVTGQPCPAMEMYERLLRAEQGAAAASWRAVCPGWAWPPDLPATLDSLRQDGHRIVIDLRPGVWLGREQLAARDQAEAYLSRNEAANLSGDVDVWR
jgi:sarcosine oxidase gamma subunit